jgi:hypothetical protein
MGAFGIFFGVSWGETGLGGRTISIFRKVQKWWILVGVGETRRRGGF